MKLERPTLVVICGWPLSGKSTVAKLVAGHLNAEITDPLTPLVHVVDIDAIRHAAIGMPYPHPNESEALGKKDSVEMGGAYKLVLHDAEWHLAQRRSLIVTATFSRRSGQQNLLGVYARHFDEKMAAKEEPCALRIIQCIPTNDSPEQVKKRFEDRGFGEGGYVGGVNSPERYFEVRDRYEPILLPHYTTKTWPHHTATDSAMYTLGHILS